MADNEYTFRIDVFTPETIPMARLAQYMAALAELVGYKESTHFVRVQAGSACLVSRVDIQDAPKVDSRLTAVNSVAPPQGAAKAFKTLDDMLAEDNAVGELAGPAGAVIIPFPGRTRPKALAFPAFRQESSIEGQIVSIGGRDKTAHIILQDGTISYSNIELQRVVARDMAKYLYGPKVRLFGNGRWERHPDGAWKLLNFTVDRHEVLDDAPLSDVLSIIRGLPGNDLLTNREMHADMMALRLGEEEIN
jgi:hypothetical protein